jgi:RNA polymerase sigma factor (sigma-70 family)
MPGDRLNLGDFEESLARCEAKAYRLAVQLVCSEPTAREIVEETFSSAWQNLDSLASSTEIETWVYQSTVKAALERDACSEGQNHSSHDHFLVLAMNARKLRLHTKSDDGPDPLPCSRRSVEIHQRIQKIVDSLPKGLRAVLVLCDLEEMDPGELGSLLGVPSEEVKRRLRSARQAVRDAVRLPRKSAATTSPRASSKRPL